MVYNERLPRFEGTMGRPHFNDADFIAAARTIADERGPAAVTIEFVNTQRLSAPKGSFYYRFASRDVLLGRLWLSTVLDYQVGFLAALEAGDGLTAALHTPAWARANMKDIRLLFLLYRRHDFVQGEWPADLKIGVRDQARRLQIQRGKICSSEFRIGGFGISFDARGLRS